MTSPREQAIEEIAGPGSTNLIRAIIDRYESARARIDGAKMMPREATEEQVAAGVTAYELTGIAAGIINTAEQHVGFIHRAMHNATPKDGER